VATRAGVTENEFRQIFPTIEDCYRAAYEHGLTRLLRTVTAAAGRQDGWLERIRSGVVALLGFFDDYPFWSQLLVLDAPISGAVAFECRQQLQDVLARLLDHYQRADNVPGSPLLTPALTGELIVGGVFSVIRTSVLENDDRQLVELAPSLMAFIVAPYLGPAAAQAELEGSPYGRSDTLAREPGRARAHSVAQLPIRATHRTTMVLRAIAQVPYSNNREVAQAAELVDEGQTSKLLTRLERRGVIENVGIGAARGEPNAWLLTPEGQRVLELLAKSTADRAPRQAGGGISGGL
jgi:AcrR family transcriptional regulator